MKNFKLYFQIAVIAILMGLLFAVNIYKAKYEKEVITTLRLTQNNLQLMDADRQNTILTLTLKEFVATMSTERDSLLRVAKIRPKTITKIIETKTIIHDTIEKKVYVQSSGKDTWFIKDSAKCWDWQAMAYLWNDSLIVNRTDFKYHNATLDVFNWFRPHKFLFIRYGKKQTTQTSSSECGETTSKTITILKR